MIKNQTKSILFAVASVLLWSTVAVSFKISLKYLDYLQLLFISSIASTFAIALVLLFNIIKNNISINEIKPNLNLIRHSALLGFLNPFLYYIVLFKAYDLLPASLAQPLNYTWVIVISIFSVIFLNQKINIKQFIALIVSFFGVVVIATKGNIIQIDFQSPLGIFLASGSSLIWGAYWIISVKNKSDGRVAMLYNFIFGSIYISIALLIFSSFDFNYFGIISAVYVGLFEMGITFLLWFNALKYSENTALTGNIVFLSPFISLIIINFVLGESIHISTIFGLILIVLGAIAQNILSAKK